MNKVSIFSLGGLLGMAFLIVMAFAFYTQRPPEMNLGFQTASIFSGGVTDSTSVIDPTTSTQALAANRNRQWAMLYTTSSNWFICSFGNTATLTAGFLVTSTGSNGAFSGDGGPIILDRSASLGPAFLGAVNCVNQSSAQATATIITVEK